MPSTLSTIFSPFASPPSRKVGVDAADATDCPVSGLHFGTLLLSLLVCVPPTKVASRRSPDPCAATAGIASAAPVSLARSPVADTCNHPQQTSRGRRHHRERIGVVTKTPPHRSPALAALIRSVFGRPRRRRPIPSRVPAVQPPAAGRRWLATSSQEPMPDDDAPVDDVL